MGLLLGCAGGRAPDPAAEQSPAPPGSATVYTCPDGFRFSARPRGDSILVSLPEGAVTLPPERAASGARYSAAGVTFWSKGESAGLERQDTARSGCAGRSASSPWEEAALLGIDFRAVGQEPGWVIVLDEGRWMRYVGDYGSITAFSAAPRREEAPGGEGVMYRGPSDRGELVVIIRPSACSDGMSGETFTHTVSVRLAGRVVDGCGRMPTSGEVTDR